MICDLLYICPVCLAEETLEENTKKLLCKNCRHEFPFSDNKIEFRQRRYSSPAFYRLIKGQITLQTSHNNEILRESGPAVLRQGNSDIRYQGFDGLVSVIQCPRILSNGKLVFTESGLEFRGTGKTWYFSKYKFSSFTTNSKYLEFVVRGQRFYQISFLSESPLKYQDLIGKWLFDESEEKILEHQPRICTAYPATPPILLSQSDFNKNQKENYKAFEKLLYFFIGLPIKWYLRFNARLTIKNTELMPDRGPFILLANHQSYLDPILFTTLFPRRIAFLTKSTSFSHRVLQHIFRAYRAIPNKRYETDPQAVRYMLHILRKGHPVGIFPEGERTWDGSTLPFKLGTIRFLLSTQVPVVIARISGAFDFLPRWSSKSRAGKIEIELLKSISLLPGRWSVAQLSQYLYSFYKINY